MFSCLFACYSQETTAQDTTKTSDVSNISIDTTATIIDTTAKLLPNPPMDSTSLANPSEDTFASEDTSAVNTFIITPPPLLPLNTETLATQALLPKPFLSAISVGLGTGMFSFIGDFNKKFQNPFVSRNGTELFISKTLNSYLRVDFHALFGKVGVDERTSRKINMESQIKGGGINVNYNFENFIHKNATIKPFISTGIESFEFLSKTDLYDKNGNKYYYWTDGSIKNMDQTGANAATLAKPLSRDYVYETDIRQQNLDGFGIYKNQTLTIPVGIGMEVHLLEKVNLRLGTTVYYSFTDYMDGMTNKSLGDRVGNKKNDKFIMTSLSLHFDIGRDDKDTMADYYRDVDFIALAKEDQDNDGVSDFKDSCANTPEGAAVDAKGCPLDSDSDGVPDYRDKELSSPANVFVDANGVQFNDSLIFLKYQMYMDTTGKFATIGETNTHTGKDYFYEKHDVVPNSIQRQYTIQLASSKKGLPPELLTKFLSIQDIKPITLEDSATVYTAGVYTKYSDAEERKNKFIKDGINEAKVVYNKDGHFLEEKSYSLVGTKAKEVKKETIINKVNVEGLVFRVQLGAYKNRLSANVFNEIKDLTEVKTDDGLYKYMTGSFRNFNEAAKLRVNMLLKGYDNAFITAYKDGKRVPLGSVGATMVKKDPENLQVGNTPISSINKKLIVFKIQVGVYMSAPPIEVQNKYKTVSEGVKNERTMKGLTRYTVGSFNDYESALKLKNNLITNYGIKDAFIIASFNNQYISLQEALELLK